MQFIIYKFQKYLFFSFFGDFNNCSIAFWILLMMQLLCGLIDKKYGVVF